MWGVCFGKKCAPGIDFAKRSPWAVVWRRVVRYMGSPNLGSSRVEGICRSSVPW